jgi:hypothetical protein
MAGSINIEKELSGDCAPRKLPDTYPGWWPGESFLLDQGEELTLNYLCPPSFGFEIVDSADRRERKSVRFPFCAGHLELLSLKKGQPRQSLAEYLRSKGLQSMENRVPVLAVGSNASPAQLAFKFRRTGAPPVIPSVLVTLRGYGAGFVPYISSFGYIPSTLIQDDRLSCQLFLQFLDRDQLDVLDASEGVLPPGSGPSAVDSPGGYNRIVVETKITLPTGEVLPKAFAYVGRRGTLTLDDMSVLSDNSRFGKEHNENPDERLHLRAEGFPSVGSQLELVELLKKAHMSLGEQVERILSQQVDEGDKASIVTAANTLLGSYSAPNFLLDRGTDELFYYGKTYARTFSPPMAHHATSRHDSPHFGDKPLCPSQICIWGS